jgi:preprotein translocase subunit SecD
MNSKLKSIIGGVSGFILICFCILATSLAEANYFGDNKLIGSGLIIFGVLSFIGGQLTIAWGAGLTDKDLYSSKKDGN